MGRILFLLVLVIACSDEQEISQAASGAGAPRGQTVAPDQEGWDVIKKVTRNGRLRVLIQSAHLRKYDREQVSRLDGGVSVTFYSPISGKVLSRLTSKQAVIDEGHRVLTAMDSVVLLSSKGSTL